MTQEELADDVRWEEFTAAPESRANDSEAKHAIAKRA